MRGLLTAPWLDRRDGVWVTAPELKAVKTSKNATYDFMVAAPSHAGSLELGAHYTPVPALKIKPDPPEDHW
jgi:hypothetical protein